MCLGNRLKNPGPYVMLFGDCRAHPRRPEAAQRLALCPRKIYFQGLTG